ncbi:hypothetical protein QRE63_29240 (plasmid) [Bacillus mycoides]|uniref:hypothetical protein n=1 Tax=Bacillus mycoides TaxID=1405 RepID=UPI001FB234D5|nr:hypothetical protein [Bacillus mycoides]UNP84335.1 hypothetical protein MN034_27660 [Bacillus mycoides]WJE67233.1 hypothetical protein QRE63_29240 [Bacillus mycoides]
MNMNFYLQQGHGMMTLNNEFVEQHKNTGVILSPRNCTRKQIEKHVKDLHAKGAKVLFDPQFYQPHTDREKILNYPYWDDLNFNTAQFASVEAPQFCEAVIKYQVEVLNVDEIILPGRYANSITEEWLNIHHTIAHTSAQFIKDRTVYSSISLGPDVVGQKPMLDRIINEAIEYPVDGFYMTLHTPHFLVADETYLYNLMDIFLSLSLAGKKVLLGYANQQDVIFAGVGVEGLATGNYRNVRSFNPEIFGSPLEKDGIQQRAVWYYDGNTLSEFRAEALRLAYQRGLKGAFGPNTIHSQPLLEAINPVATNWGEPAAFRHYLTLMNDQWTKLSDVPPAQRMKEIIGILEATQKILQDLIDQGFRTGERSFDKVLDSTLNAITAFVADREYEIELLN